MRVTIKQNKVNELRDEINCITAFFIDDENAPKLRL